MVKFTQHNEYTKCHWILLFKIMDFILWDVCNNKENYFIYREVHLKMKCFTGVLPTYDLSICFQVPMGFNTWQAIDQYWLIHLNYIFSSHPVICKHTLLTYNILFKVELIKLYYTLWQLVNISFHLENMFNMNMFSNYFHFAARWNLCYIWKTAQSYS